MDLPEDIYRVMAREDAQTARVLARTSTTANLATMKEINTLCRAPISLREIDDYLWEDKPIRMGFMTWYGNIVDIQTIPPSYYYATYPYQYINIEVFDRKFDGEYKSIGGYRYSQERLAREDVEGVVNTKGSYLDLLKVPVFVPDAYTMFAILRKRVSCARLGVPMVDFALQTTHATVAMIHDTFPAPQAYLYANLAQMVKDNIHHYNIWTSKSRVDHDFKAILDYLDRWKTTDVYLNDPAQMNINSYRTEDILQGAGYNEAMGRFGWMGRNYPYNPQPTQTFHGVGSYPGQPY